MDRAEDPPRQIRQHQVRKDRTDSAPDVYPKQGSDLHAPAVQPNLLALGVANRNPRYDAEGDGKSPGNDDDSAE